MHKGEMQQQAVFDFVSGFWDKEILPSLQDYIRIPNKSPMFDPEWQRHGYMDEAVQHVMHWVDTQAVPGLQMSLHQLEGRTPVLYLTLPGTGDDTVLIYGHLDKQPEFTGWYDDLDPWIPVLRQDKLYGRGGADDGYAIYSAIAAIKALQAQNLDMPRIAIIIECSEESGSPDLLYYMDALEQDIGGTSLVIALDSSCGNYDQLWMTTSLRGMLLGELTVSVLEQGAHSGAAGGIVPSSFQILRHLISRLEDENTGAITPPFLNEQIPQMRHEEAAAAGKVLAQTFSTMFTYDGDCQPVSDDPTELVINNSWRSSLEVTGVDGIPSLQDAGNVLRPSTAVKLALRLSPTTDAATAADELTRLLTKNPPYGSTVSFELEVPNPGWHAPLTEDSLEQSFQRASTAFFGAPAMSMGCGGSIPFMGFLAQKLTDAQFMVTGVLGPHSNAHGPNEFLHIPMAKKLTACIAQVIHDRVSGS